MEKASGMKKINAVWSVDLIKSGKKFELFIVDERSRQTIVRSPLDLADASSVTNILRGAFRSFGAPVELRTDSATLFGTSFGDLMHSCGISYRVAAAGTAARKGLAERLARA
jgi:hypothetical protein